MQALKKNEEEGGTQENGNTGKNRKRTVDSMQDPGQDFKATGKALRDASEGGKKELTEQAM